MRKLDLTRRAQAGFTLIELAVVILIIATIAAISYPRLEPIIAYGEVEGAARHFANFGRAANARATMLREPITVRFDFETQEYYAVRWVQPVDEDDEEAQEAEQQLAMLNEYFKSDNFSQEDLAAMLSGDPEAMRGAGPSELDPEVASRVLQDEFDKFVRRSTEARARNVVHDGFLSEIGPLFEDDFTLEEEEPIEEEITEFAMRRARIPAPVEIQQLYVGEQSHSGGVVEIELTPLGIPEDVQLTLGNEDGGYFTVVWDAVTGSVRMIEGNDY